MDVKTAGANLEAYQALANEGTFVKKDGDGDGVHATGKSGILGKVPKWLAKRNAGDNRELKQQFLRDISQTFGSDFADKVKGDINPEGRSPLSASKINRVFEQARTDFGAAADLKIGNSGVVAEFSEFGEGSELRKLIGSMNPNFYTGNEEADTLREATVAHAVANALKAKATSTGQPVTLVEAALISRDVVRNHLGGNSIASGSTPVTLAACFANNDVEGAVDTVKALVKTVNDFAITASFSQQGASDGSDGISRLLNMDAQMEANLSDIDQGLKDQFDPILRFAMAFDTLSMTNNPEVQEKLSGFIEKNQDTVEGSNNQFKKTESGQNSQAFTRLKNNPVTELTNFSQQITTRIPLLMSNLVEAKDDYEASGSQKDLKQLRNLLGELKSVSSDQRLTIKRGAAAIQVPGLIESAPQDFQPFLREAASTLAELDLGFAADGGILSELFDYADDALENLPPLAPTRSDV